MPITPITPSGSNAPNDLPSDAAGAVAVPNTLPSDAAGAVNTPNTLSADAAGAVAVPNTLPADGAGSVASPVSLPSVTAAAAPRTLTPMVNLDFAAKSYARKGRTVLFDDLLTYTRPSSATFINRRPDVDGGYEYFLDNDYVGGVTNLFKHSEDFGDTDWNKTNMSFVTNTAISPFGDLTADRATSQDVAFDFFSQIVTAVIGQYYTVSFYVKAATASTYAFRSWLNSGGVNYFKIITPTNEWQKVEFTVVASGTSLLFQNSILSTGGVFDIYIWGAQLTKSAKPLPYVKTLASAVTQTFTETLRVEYDAATGENLGALIEGGSTNTLTKSEEISQWSVYNQGGLQTLNITDNYGLAPDNTMSASRLVGSLADATSNSRLIVRKSPVVGSTFTLSFWVKSLTGDYTASFHFKGAPTGTVAMTSEWQRVSISGTSTNATENLGIDIVGHLASSLNFDFLMWGGQVEVLPFATSYIRTEGAAVTRSSDKLSLPTSNFKESEYTLYVKGNNSAGSTNQVFASIESSSDRLTILGGNVSSYIYQTLDGVITRLQSGLATTDTVNITATFKDGNQVGFLNGLSYGQTATGILPTLTAFSLGFIGYNSEPLYGHISKFKTYSKAMTAQEITLL
jgi:hypothetical protein